MAVLSEPWHQGLVLLLDVILIAQGGAPGSNRVHYDGSNGKLTGEGVVCCPCKVPCPCRSNGTPSFGHCEPTLYLRIAQGNYGSEKLDGVQVVESGGMCAVNYQRLSAFYFEPSTTRAHQLAFMKLLASFSPENPGDFSHVRVLPFDSEVKNGHLFRVVIPGTLEMMVDRNWARQHRPCPWWLHKTISPIDYSTRRTLFIGCMILTQVSISITVTDRRTIAKSI